MVVDISFGVPKKYQKKAASLRDFLCFHNPFIYLARTTSLEALAEVKIHHRALGYAAEFRTPNNIYIDFRQPVKYLALSIAHEFAHLLLRTNKWSSKRGIRKLINRHKSYLSPRLGDSFEYSIEQALAILLQLAYEERAKISKFSKKRARELMKSMDVWEVGEKLLKVWPDYSKSKCKNIVGWVERVLS